MLPDVNMLINSKGTLNKKKAAKSLEVVGDIVMSIIINSASNYSIWSIY
jgi:hypothetical protein